ncbi:NAC transcription factor ONAC010 [Apostasia shenzhenica]|uniref:NAC transcription factor ONAC010 n=1 Tax=Apostasia shenzhenica TaxID=1088818 RepID=A0A2I0AXI7_9ASPA|nr:NAC transcription factor ONAC010 [Apostasia shenzhenica]
MERKEFMKLGSVRLPPGFRFQPTDEELVVQYLRRKALSCPLPACIIPEIDLRKYDPWDLPIGIRVLICSMSGYFGGERYYFYHREKKNVEKTRRGKYYQPASSGYWKAVGKEKQVLASRSNEEVVGTKQELVFFIGKLHRGLKTDWIMHEYCLSDTKVPKSINLDFFASSKEWVVCRIMDKRRTRKQRAKGTRDQQQNRVPPLSPSSSSSSCITDICDKEFINGEEAVSNALIAS